MRILFLTHAYPPHELGGWSQQCEEIALALQQRGHVAHILTSHFGVRRGEIPENGITRSLHFQANIQHYRPLDYFWRRPICERQNLSVLRRVIRTFRPDLVFVWGMWNLSHELAYWAEQWMTPARVAYAIADYWPLEPDMHGVYWRLPARHRAVEAVKSLARKWILPRLDRSAAEHRPKFQNVACVSHYVLEKLLQANAVPAHSRVIYNGIDPEPFARCQRSCRRDGSLRLLYFGSISQNKGVHTAIEALGALRRRGLADGLELLIVGAGHPDYMASLRQLVAESGLKDCVAWRGQVRRSQVPAILGMTDVFLFTSIYEEPIARTVMEAMAAGVAVIGTAVGGQREMLVDGQNALVFDPGDAEGLARCIIDLRDNDEKLQRLVEGGKETVMQRFTLLRMVDEMEQWLQAILLDEAA